jgi:D-alanyl-D-alanine carboxypeptidase/D-alanyl-D-alanine-endopeptidase (penicillin-binding protein 4)
MVLGTSGVSAAEDALPGFARQFDQTLAQAEYAVALWGIEVRSLTSGEVLFEYGASTNMQPASTLKLVTTAAALDAFGPQRRFATAVETAARVDERGRLLGDLYLVGGGDPGLSARHAPPVGTLEALAETLFAAGIRRVEGRLIGHEGLFEASRRPEGWDWEDLVWGYGAEVSALSFHDNSVDLRASPGQGVGAPLVVVASPSTAYYQLTSSATTSPRGSKQELKLTRELGGNRIHLSGTFPRRSRAWKGSVALEDPARYAATVLREVLTRRGITVVGDVETSADPLPETRRVLARHEGPALAALLREVNKESMNLHAELLLRQLGLTRGPKGSAESGREAVDAFLAKLHVGSQHWAIRDGSGLSEANLVSAHGMVDLLVAMDRHPEAEVFRQSLAVSGVDGTLQYRLRTVRRRILAKTGALAHVRGLVGYATREDGDRLAFAILLNHYTGQRGTRAIDRLAATLVQ